MIGLKRGKVKLVRHQLSWSRTFESERRRILNKVGSLIVDLQHIGSTSVPGIEAKPIIDMSAGISRLKDASKLITPLHALGYKFYRKFARQILFAKGPDSRRTHYLHIMRYKSSKWNSDMLFRNYLRNHLSRAKAYMRLKLKLAEQHPDNREKYSDGKNKFIKETIGLAGRHRIYK